MSQVVFNQAKGNLWITIARFPLDNDQAEYCLVVSELESGKETLVREDIGTFGEALDIANAAFAAVETVDSAPVESIKVGEYVKRKADSKKVYMRGAYDASTQRYPLEDADDTNRWIWVNKGTVLFIGFTY